MSILKELRQTTQHLRKVREPHDPDAPLLRTEHLSLAYETVPALVDINFQLQPGDRLAIVGPNGAGKSTLLKIIAGVLEPNRGKVFIYGHEPGGHICVAYVPQRNQVDWRFPVTVGDVVMMGRVGQMGLLRNPSARDWELVHHALEVVGMESYAGRQISQLSGGQQQRMFIARSLAQEAELMLMDEPLTGLDVKSQEDIFNILDNLQKQGVTVLLSLHDLDIAAKRFNLVMLLNKKMITMGPPEVALSPEKLVEAYGGHLTLIDTPEGVMPVADSCCGGGEE